MPVYIVMYVSHKLNMHTGINISNLNFLSFYVENINNVKNGLYYSPMEVNSKANKAHWTIDNQNKSETMC